MCDSISKGRGLGCPDAISGLLNVYFVNRGAVDDRGQISFKDDSDRFNPATEEITSPAAQTAKPVAYRYELHLGNDLTQNITASPENGTLYFEQVLNLTLKKMSSGDNLGVKSIARNRPWVFVEDQMGNIMLVGRINGANVTGGTAVTGNDYGDLNGYTLSLTGREKDLANFYDVPANFFSDFAVEDEVGNPVTG